MSMLHIIDNCVDYGHLARVWVAATFLYSIVKIGVSCADGVLIVCCKKLHRWFDVGELKIAYSKVSRVENVRISVHELQVAS